MPIYDYKCEHCGNCFELLQDITAESIAICPKCKHSAQRQISRGVGFILKGSGFYINDYKKKAKVSNSKPAETTSPKSKKSSENKSASSEKKQ
ncbi:MAG: FmdB family zinc ribbon protein [bacterium]